MDHMVDANPERYASPFLRKAVQMVLDVGEIGLIERALYATIVASNHVGGLIPCTSFILSISARSST